nr:transcription factor BIM2-like isoform X3 [Ipomoea batatas]
MVAVKVEGKSGDRKANAVRSKHSETEQRRRSKINERFQILRDLIPENDNKRDKASFLLEVCYSTLFDYFSASSSFYQFQNSGAMYAFTRILNTGYTVHPVFTREDTNV